MIEPNEEPSYDEIIVKINQPPPPTISSVDKKRLNKTVTCPLCNKSMNEKTLKYSHNCQTKKEKQAPIITDDQIQIYLQNKHLEQQEHQNAIRQNKFNNLIKNMV